MPLLTDDEKSIDSVDSMDSMASVDSVDSVDCIDYDDKIRGEANYEHLFKNRGKISAYHSTRSKHFGNTLSMACARPKLRTNMTRIVEKSINRDTVKHLTVDYHSLETSYLYKKSSVQLIIPYDDGKTAVKKGNTHYSIKKYRKDRTDPPRITKVEALSPKLWIGNRTALNKETLSENGIDIIINFSSDLFSKTDLGLSQVHNIKFDDGRRVEYSQFTQIMSRVHTIIDQNLDQHILIACNRGSNRSVAMAMSYGIRKHSYTFERVCNIIDQAKNDVSWGSLTNLTFCRILRQLVSNHMRGKMNYRWMSYSS